MQRSHVDSPPTVLRSCASLRKSHSSASSSAGDMVSPQKPAASAMSPDVSALQQCSRPHMADAFTQVVTIADGRLPANIVDGRLLSRPKASTKHKHSKQGGRGGHEPSPPPRKRLKVKQPAAAADAEDSPFAKALQSLPKRTFETLQRAALDSVSLSCDDDSDQRLLSAWVRNWHALRPRVLVSDQVTRGHSSAPSWFKRLLRLGLMGGWCCRR